MIETFQNLLAMQPPGFSFLTVPVEKIFLNNQNSRESGANCYEPTY